MASPSTYLGAVVLLFGALSKRIDGLDQQIEDVVLSIEEAVTSCLLPVIVMGSIIRRTRLEVLRLD